jgi:hypothetical protein
MVIDSGFTRADALRVAANMLDSGKTLRVDGETIEVRGTGGELAHRPYLWIPSTRAIVGNIAVFGNLHVWTADTQKPSERQAWLTQLDEMLALQPARVARQPQALRGRTAEGHQRCRTHRDDAEGLPDRRAGHGAGHRGEGRQGGSEVVKTITRRIALRSAAAVVALGLCCVNRRTPWSIPNHRAAEPLVVRHPSHAGHARFRCWCWPLVSCWPSRCAKQGPIPCAIEAWPSSRPSTRRTGRPWRS